MHQLNHCTLRSAWSNCWPHRMISWCFSWRTRRVLGQTARNPDIKTEILRIQTSWRLTRHPFLRQRTPGGGQLAPHDRVQFWAATLYRVSENSVRDPTTLMHNWSLVGLLHLPHYPLIIKSHGVSSVLPSMAITYRWVFYAASCRCSLTYNKGTASCMTTTASSIASPNMGLNMLTQTKRKLSSFAKGSRSNYRII
jgi:hypothetical protein